MNELLPKSPVNSFYSLNNEFQNLKNRQFDNIYADNLPMLHKTDVELEAVFTELLNHDVSSHAEKLEKLGFLLETLCPTQERSAIEDRICNHIIEICTSP